MANAVPLNNERKQLEKTVDHCLIKWKISEFLKLSELCDKRVTSPIWHTNSEQWSLVISADYLGTGENIIKFMLLRGIVGDKSCATVVTYRLGIKVYTTAWFGERRKINFNLGSCDIVEYNIHEHFSSVSSLKTNTLTVFCEMYIAYAAIEQLFPARESLDLLCLSFELLSCWEKSRNTDVKIRIKNESGDEILAHKAILSARSSVFAEMFKHFKSIIYVKEDDYKHIPSILKYIYSGRLDWIATDGIFIGLYECAKRYNVKGMVNILTPTEISIDSKLEYSFTREFTNISRCNTKPGKCISSSPLQTCGTISPIWYLDIYPKGCDMALDSIGITVRAENFKITSDLNLYISILKKVNNECCIRNDISEVVCGNFRYNFPNFINKKQLEDKGLLRGDRLVVHFKVIREDVLYAYDKTSIVATSIFSKYSCLEELSADMEKLLYCSDFSDSKIVSDDSIFNVHKAIISERSTVLALLFQTIENKNYVLGLTDISPELLEHIIFYIYTGRIRHPNKQLIIAMYSSAKLYCIRSLSNSCVGILMGSLDKHNVCKIVSLAYKYKDRTLFKSCFYFIRNKTREVLTSTEWSRLIRLEFDLSSKILEWLQNPTKEFSFY